MSDPSVLHLAAVEGGGSSFRLAVCSWKLAAADAIDENVIVESPPVIVAQTEVATDDDPTVTLRACAAFLEKYCPASGYHALGLTTFGPVGLHPDRESYGKILPTTPKANWRNVDLLSPLRKACEKNNTGQSLAVLVETDVNAPAYLEYLLAKGKNATRTISSCAYVTVGTGIGVGLVVNGGPVHGRLHPEGGHVPIQPLPDDPFRGYSWGAKSPFGGRQTVEGTASSVALSERLAQRRGTDEKLPLSVLAELQDDDEIFDHAANALANLCATLLLSLAVEKIVLGGGILRRKGLLEKIQERTSTILNGYLELPKKEDMGTLICTSERYGHEIGLHGAIALAQRAVLKQKGQSPLDDAKAKKAIQQVAFNVGLWHGIILGAIGTGLVVKYTLFGKSRK